MFALLYCLHAPHFPAASMRQFYRRAETERAKRGDGGDGRRGEGLMKMELNAYAVTEFKWRRSQPEDQRGTHTRGKGQTGGVETESENKSRKEKPPESRAKTCAAGGTQRRRLGKMSGGEEK